MSSTNYVLRISNYHIHLMRCAARQLDGGRSPGALITNPFHIVHKLQEARRKVCSTTWNSYSTTWNGCFSTWNSYFTSWNAKVYYILLVLFLLSRALASKLRFLTIYYLVHSGRVPSNTHWIAMRRGDVFGAGTGSMEIIEAGEAIFQKECLSSRNKPIC